MSKARAGDCELPARLLLLLVGFFSKLGLKDLHGHGNEIGMDNASSVEAVVGLPQLVVADLRQGLPLISGFLRLGDERRHASHGVRAADGRS